MASLIPGEAEVSTLMKVQRASGVTYYLVAHGRTRAISEAEYKQRGGQ